MILIQCTSSKRDEPAQARNLYDESTLFRAMREYATAKDDDWCILSAKHGLVHPYTELEPYNEFGLSEKQATEIAEKLSEIGITTVEVVAGKKYTNPLVPELERREIGVIDNFAGMRIGDRVRKLNIEAAKLKNQSLC